MYWPKDLLITVIALVLFLIFGWIKLISINKRLQKLEYQINPESKPTPIPVASMIPAAKLPDSLTPISTVKAGQPSILNQWFAKLLQIIKNFFTQGNVVAKVGIIILFFGVAFLAKYAAERNVFPVELRLIMAALVAMVLLSLGWFLRDKKTNYALTLQGGGLAIFFLTVFIAYRMFGLIPALPTLLIMIFLTLSGVFLALAQNSRSLAILAIIGGFLAPIMASTGHGSHIILFSYYSILNVGILVIAWFKAWRVLNILGFLFTFVIASLWGFYQYQPQFYLSNQFFLIFHVIFYVTVSILFAYRQAPRLQYYADSTLLFGTPIVASALQFGLVHNKPFGLALSALVAGVFYVGVARFLTRFKHYHFQLLIEVFLILGMVFATLALPLALDDRLAATIWALEGAGIVWLSVRQDRWLRRLLGVLLQFAAGVLFFDNFPNSKAMVPVINAAFMGCAMIAFSGIASAYCLMKSTYNKMRWEYSLMPWTLFIWGCLWWYAGGQNQISTYLYPIRTLNEFWNMFFHNAFSVKYYASMLFFALSALFAWALKQRLNWDAMRYPTLLIFPVMLMIALTLLIMPHSVSMLSWIIVFSIGYVVLCQHDKDSRGYLSGLHVMTTLLLVIEMIIQLHYDVSLLLPRSLASETWELIITGIVPSLFLVGITMPGRWLQWPVSLHSRAYVGYTAFILANALMLWILIANVVLAGDMRPLIYLPILNPLDIIVLLAFTSILYWFYLADWKNHLKFIDRIQKYFIIALSFLAFIFANAILLRSLHHWLDIPYEWKEMMESIIVQMSLSIFWTSLALVLTLIAARKQWRILWFSGAGLIAIVALKLILIDLINRGTIERVVSFMVVGGLMLIIGYFAPLPPKKTK